MKATFPKRQLHPGKRPQNAVLCKKKVQYTDILVNFKECTLTGSITMSLADLHITVMKIVIVRKKENHINAPDFHSHRESSPHLCSSPSGHPFAALCQGHQRCSWLPSGGSGSIQGPHAEGMAFPKGKVHTLEKKCNLQKLRLSMFHNSTWSLA